MGLYATMRRDTPIGYEGLLNTVRSKVFFLPDARQSTHQMESRSFDKRLMTDRMFYSDHKFLEQDGSTVHHHRRSHNKAHHAEQHGADADARTRRGRAFCDGSACRGPISPRGLEHEDEGLALGTLCAFDGKVKGVYDGRQPAVDRKVWCAHERTRRRRRRPWRGPGRRGWRARGCQCREIDYGEARRAGSRAVCGKECRTRALCFLDKPLVAGEKHEAVNGRSEQRAARRVVEIGGVIVVCIILEQTVRLLHNR